MFVQSVLECIVDGASTTCCGNAFQLLITLVLKNDLRACVGGVSVHCQCCCMLVNWGVGESVNHCVSVLVNRLIDASLCW